MPNCPVCDTEYKEEQMTCPSCCWLVSDVDLRHVGEIINWAKQRWSEKCQAELKCQQLEKENQQLLAQQNPPSLSETQLKTFEEQLRKVIGRVYQLEQSEQKLNSQIETLKSQLEELTLKREKEEKFFSEIPEEIKKFKEERSQFESRIKQFEDERLQIQQQFSPIQNKLEEIEYNLQLNERLNLGSKDVPSFSQKNASLYPDINPSQQEQFEVTQAKRYISIEESKLAQKYNRNLGTLSQQAIEVNATDESLSNLRIGSISTVIFEKKRRGNYWILKEEGYEYLVPSNNLRINQHNYKTVEVLFECRGFQPGSSEDFNLSKPAKVTALSGGETWQLDEPGILEF